MTTGSAQIMLFCMARPGRRISTPAAYKREFMERTREARIDAGLSYGQIADALTEAAGRPIAADSYRKWEKTALLPQDLIVPFCEITRIHPAFLLAGPAGSTGKGSPLGGLTTKSTRAA
jgi:hypothetical protein